MKTIPPPCPEPETGPKYWRSLDQLAETPEFNEWLHREFPVGASEFTDPTSRRHFVKIMSASFLFGGLALTGCRRPVEHILPFSKLPENYTHGVAQFYATAMPNRGNAVPLLVRSNDGRPTKIEPNPALASGTDAFAQASILNLYDPDRAMRFTRGGNDVSAAEARDFLDSLGRRFASNGGAGLRFMAERSSSPSRERLQKLIATRFPQARWHVYEPVDFTNAEDAASMTTGQMVKQVYRFEKAARILSLDSDFMCGEEDGARSLRGFAAGRRAAKPTDEINRLYVVEGLFSVTGAAADHRLRVAPSQVLGVAARIAMAVSPNVPEEVRRIAQTAGQVDDKWIAECAKDLAGHRGKSLVVAGYRQPLAVHLIAFAINQAIGAVGSTVELHPRADIQEARFSELVQALNGNQVDTLVILGCNPSYTAPADTNWNSIIKNAKTVVRLGYYEDESFASATWHLPQAHYLESWGDGRTADGTVLCIQPLIEPLFGGISENEVLARIAGSPQTRPYDIVRATFGGNTVNEERWRQFVHDGFLANSAPTPITVGFNATAAAEALRGINGLPTPTANSLEVVYHRDYSVDDGRYCNNGWLQEAPDPITKVVWENVISVSPATAKALNLNALAGRSDEQLKNNERVNDDGNFQKNDIVEVEVNGRKVRGPVWIQPGQADNTIALALGYGRERVGRVGHKTGYNAYLVRASNAPYVVANGKITKTGAMTRVVTTQEHGAMEGRPIVREANLTEWRKKPDFAKNMDLEAHAPNAGPIYKHPYNARPETKSNVHQWGMAIDMSTCVGCNACVIACQSENNVPIVGKDQVNRGREMHWLRIDRYYTGDVTNPQVASQPMFCQHCESAPCESVCPVNATVHDEEGINVMAYNRCVGTRYCSNNCAWKVRRFNFFDFNKRPKDYSDMSKGAAGLLYKGPLAKREPIELDLLSLISNPDVSVRMRGVMEKCTFCIQRIEGAKIQQKVKAKASGDVAVPDGTFTTACAQACPADSIAFGNILDPNSRVSQLKNDPRNYAVLGFLDTKPRLTYLARIRNPNPAISGTATTASMDEYIKAHNPSPFEEHGGGHSAGAKGGSMGTEKGVQH